MTDFRNGFRIRSSPLVFVMVFVLAAGARSARSEGVLWYGGDFGACAGAGICVFNNARLLDLQGDSVLDDFVVPAGFSWHITGLFSNNQFQYPYELEPFTQALWSLRTGVGTNNPGHILFSGISPVAIASTGRIIDRFPEHTVTVSDLSIDLPSGTYFASVSPLVNRYQIYYVPGSDGSNAIGGAGEPGIFQEEHFVVAGGVSQDLVRNYSNVHAASLGAIGSEVMGEVPEPGSNHLLAMALLTCTFLKFSARREGRERQRAPRERIAHT
jgi:hypothetical protein